MAVSFGMACCSCAGPDKTAMIIFFNISQEFFPHINITIILWQYIVGVICNSDCRDYYIVTERVIVIADQYLYGVLLDRVERENQASR